MIGATFVWGGIEARRRWTGAGRTIRSSAARLVTAEKKEEERERERERVRVREEEGERERLVFLVP